MGSRAAVLACALALAVAAPAAAQVVTTGPIDTSMKFVVDLPENVPLSDGPSWTFKFWKGTAGVAELTAPTCTLVNSIPTCSFPIPQAAVDAFNMAGLHELRASMLKAGLGESGPSAPFVLKSPPGVPRAVRITR